MQFDVEELYKKSTKELRSLFSSIAKTENQLVLKGKFDQGGILGSSHVAEALAYLPKHVTSAVFKVDYCFSRESRTVVVETYWDGRTSKKTVYDTKKGIGAYLQCYVASLPESIKFVTFTFNEIRYQHDISTVSLDFADVLRKLPLKIRVLVLSNLFIEDFDDFRIDQRDKIISIQKVLQAIPPKIDSLVFQKLELGKLSSDERKTIFSGLNSGVTSLCLGNAEFYRVDGDFAANLPSNLVKLDLAGNELNKKTINGLGLVLFSLSSLQALKTLRLRNNKLSLFKPRDLARVLAILPDTLEELDLGENGLLLLNVDFFKVIMNELSKTIKRLRLTERGVVLSKDQVKSHFLFLPRHIEVISFSSGNLLGFSVIDFIDVISWLPDTVKILSLNDSDLCKRSVEELVYLFSHLPPHLRGLKLTHNFLARFKSNELKIILSTIPSFITEVDISENGLDRLPFSEMQDILHCFPTTVKKIITGEFKIRNDGALVPYRGLAEISLLNSQKRFHHQAEFAKLRLVLMQLALGSLNMDVGLHILSFVLEASEAEMKRLKYPFMSLIISSLPPKEITAEHEDDCWIAINQRIKVLRATDTCLDLSRCGLNRLKSEESKKSFAAILKSLSKEISILKLRGNGFLRDARCEAVFAALVSVIPGSIKCLDLSANDFEYQSAEELNRLFRLLPPTVQFVILDHEEPLPPKVQIAKRYWPESYFNLVKNLPDKMQQTRILLDDYTKGESVLKRLLCGHSNRRNIVEAARRVHFIKEGLITDPDDLRYECEQTPLTNEAGSLAKRYSFLAYHQSKPAEDLTSEEHEDNKRIEMKPLSRKI